MAYSCLNGYSDCLINLEAILNCIWPFLEGQFDHSVPNTGHPNS